MNLDYPSLYYQADLASRNAQKKYLRVMKLNLVLTISGSVSLFYSQHDQRISMLAITLFLFVLGLIIFSAFKRYDVTWYNGRAVAESVKTSAWRFAMRAEPYENSIGFEIAVNEFCGHLRDILDQNRELGKELAGPKMSSDALTSSMKSVRELNLSERADYYMNHRVQDQLEWYSSKAKMNKRRGGQWFISLVVVYVVIIVAMIAQMLNNWEFIPIGSLIVLGSSVLSWTQLRRYQDLATSYTLAAYEIGILKSQGRKENSEEQFSDYVKDAENAFSREHTQWVARKDN